MKGRPSLVAANRVVLLSSSRWTCLYDNNSLRGPILLGVLMASRSRLCFFTLFCFLACPAHARADKLRITSSPSGATVEIDGVSMGTTPFEKEYPGGYFHKTRTSFGARLEHPMVARISLQGYATKELELTEGPMLWVSLYGRVRAEYWLLKSNHFEAELQPLTETFTGAVSAEVSGGSLELKPPTVSRRINSSNKACRGLAQRLDRNGFGFFRHEYRRDCHQRPRGSWRRITARCSP